MNNKTHLYLKNEKGTVSKFDRTRGQKDPPEEDHIERNYRLQKDRLYNDNIEFDTDKSERHNKRNDILPDFFHYDLIEIYFLKIIDYKFSRIIERDYGIKAVNYSNFNQTVLFAIDDEERFKQNFQSQIKKYYESPGNDLPEECHKLTCIQDFNYLNSNKIIQNLSLNNLTQNILIRFIDESRISPNKFSTIEKKLTDFLVDRNIQRQKISNSLLQINNIQENDLELLLDNFDIIQKVQGLRYLRVSPDDFGIQRFDTGLNINILPDAPTIGILDTGVENISPISNIIESEGIDIANPESPAPYHVWSDHGTSVAALASFGWNFYHEKSNTIDADAKIFSIKVQSDEVGAINIAGIKQAIEDAYTKHNIRIFNLSMNVGSKNYNSDISDYAYILDQLSYKNDILIFISTGNLSIDDIEEMQNEKDAIDTSEDIKGFLTYPNHFYNPNMTAQSHICECTNLCEPAESMNNITVGALAGNLKDEENWTDLSESNELPAYYTRKYYIDYNQYINHTPFKKNQKNKNLFKPDVVMYGGDLLKERSMMQIIGYNGTELIYRQSSGTSYATPLVANIAAKILRLYPTLNMQSVKALLINSATPIKDDYLKELISDLNREESEDTSKKYNNETINKNLTGHGIINVEKCLYSNEKRVIFIIEDSIKYDSHKAINLNIPTYLYTHKKQKALTITATLCYKFDPVFGNSISYNPVHISFNIGNSMNKDDPMMNADEYASTRKSKNNARMAIKANAFTWSDDFYPASSKLFSNVQKRQYNISPSELKKINSQLTIIIRCIVRDDDIYQEQVQKYHNFSLIFCIEENQISEFDDISLYDEIEDINIVENVAETFAEATIETENRN